MENDSAFILCYPGGPSSPFLPFFSFARALLRWCHSLLLRLQPLFKCQHDIVLIFIRAAGEESSEYGACEYGQGPARVRQNILPIAQVIDGQRVAVVAPEFRNTEGCVDWKLGDRLVMDVDLD